jgi:hypothetical protein
MIHVMRVLARPVRKRRVPRHEVSHWFTVGGSKLLLSQAKGFESLCASKFVSLAELVDEFVVDEMKTEAEYLPSEKALMVFLRLLYCS